MLERSRLNDQTRTSGLLVCVVLIAIACATRHASANPSGGQVAAGNASIASAGQTLTVNQTSQRAIINWQSFSLGQGETTNFLQPSASAIALNRVTGIDPSTILGSLNANGQIWLINPNGIAFGKTARVDVAGLLATTIDIADSKFLGGNYAFSGLRNPGAMVTNAGRITIHDAGLAALVAPGVENSGIIQANLGQIQLSSAAAFTVDFYGDGLFNFSLDQQVTQQFRKQDGTAPIAAVSNSGQLVANGGRILLTANVASSVVNNAINMSGIAQATSATQSNGEIVLDGGGAGTVQVSGALDASGRSLGQTGGTAEVTGQSVQLAPTAKIDVSGNAGGGTALVGGDVHGSGLLRQAETTDIAKGATINANADYTGSGGKIVIWSTDQTSFDGSLTAHGGIWGGNGGTAEVSSHGVLGFTGTADLRALFGGTGTLLLDPENVTISSTGAMPHLPDNGPIDFDAHQDDSVLSVTTLQNALAFADVTVSTGSVGTQAGDITVASSVHWSGGYSLTLSAYRNVALDDGVTISNTGSGNLFLRADNTGTGIGTVSFASTGMVDWSASTGLVSIYYNPSDNPPGGTLQLFSDNFNRPDGPVGNGWTETSGNTPFDLAIASGALTTLGPNDVGGVYRGINLSGEVVVSADLTQENGFGGLLGRYTTALMFGNDGTVGGGYGVFFYRGDQTYADSEVQLILGNTTLASINSSFQFGAQIHTTVTLLPNGDISGVVTGDGNTFTFDFGARSIALPGANFAIVENGSDSRSALLTEPTVDNVAIAQFGTAYTSPTDFSAHVVTNGSVNHQLTAYMLVNSVNDLQDVQNNLAGNYALGRDIDATATASWNAGAGFLPLGSLTTPFSGTFDGLNHSINGLAVNNQEFEGNAGLFGVIGVGGTVRNVALTLANIVGGVSDFVGALAAQNFGIIDNDSSSGTVTGGDSGSGITRAGGLVGYNGGTIENSNSSANVTVGASGPQAAYGGGLVGANASGTILDSYATGSVKGGIGASTGFGQSVAVGGLVGNNNYSGVVSESYAGGSVSVGPNGTAGGLAGYNQNSSNISNSYATGSVSVGAGGIGGGFIGAEFTGGTISDSYSVGAVTGAATLGGFEGEDASGGASNVYWDINASGLSTSAAGVGLSTSVLKSALPAGFSNTIWDLLPAVNNGYPSFVWQSLGGATPETVVVKFGKRGPSTPAELVGYLQLAAGEPPPSINVAGSTSSYISPIQVPGFDPTVVQSIAAAIIAKIPQLTQFISEEELNTAIEDAITVTLQNSDLTPQDISDFVTGYFQSSGYRTLINQSASGAFSKDLALGILSDLTGSLAEWIAKKNGASATVASFDKNLTGFVVTGLLAGPAAEAVSAAVQIVESGAQLTISDVNNFNQEIALAESVANSADLRAQQLLRNGNHVQAEAMLAIAAGERKAIADLYAEHPIIATLSEIPNTISNFFSNF